MGLLSDFKSFITKGNVIDLAVAVVIGVAFNNVINGLVTDMVTPLIGIPGHANFTAMTYTFHGSTFLYGSFINAVINFIVIAAVLFFLVVRPVTKLEKMRQSKQQPSPTTKTCPECLSTIPVKAKRCMYCTSKLSG